MKVIESEFKLSDLLIEIYYYYKLRINQSETIHDLNLNLSITADKKNISIRTDSQRLNFKQPS